MDESFYQALLRVSISQILKASGFDKCKPTVLNIITDIYIRQFEHILSVTKSFALERSSITNEICAPDVLQALLGVGLLKPAENSQGDPYTNTKSLDSFVNWARYSTIFSASKKLNTIPASLLYNLMEKRKIDTSAETDQERKKRRLRERQEFYNQLKQNDDTADTQNLLDDLEDEELQTKDKLSWLAYLAEKDVKLGQNMKFLNSCIQDDLMAVHKNKKYHPAPPGGEDSYSYFKTQVEKSIKNDHIIISHYEPDEKDPAKEPSVTPSAQLKDALPYNIKYSEVLLDDDLSQFIGYAERHEDEISERLAAIEKRNEQNDESQRDSDQNKIQEAEESVPVPESDAPEGDVPEVVEVADAVEVEPESVAEAMIHVEESVNAEQIAQIAESQEADEAKEADEAENVSLDKIGDMEEIQVSQLADATNDEASVGISQLQEDSQITGEEKAPGTENGEKDEEEKTIHKGDDSLEGEVENEKERAEAQDEEERAEVQDEEARAEAQE